MSDLKYLCNDVDAIRQALERYKAIVAAYDQENPPNKMAKIAGRADGLVSNVDFYLGFIEKRIARMMAPYPWCRMDPPCKGCCQHGCGD